MSRTLINIPTLADFAGNEPPLLRNELIGVAIRGYPGNEVFSNDPGEEPKGDTLALFIHREIAETFDDTADNAGKLGYAKHLMNRAIEEISDVRDALHARQKEAIDAEDARQAQRGKITVLGQYAGLDT